MKVKDLSTRYEHIDALLKEQSGKVPCVYLKKAVAAEKTRDKRPGVLLVPLRRYLAHCQQLIQAQIQELIQLYCHRYPDSNLKSTIYKFHESFFFIA